MARTRPRGKGERAAHGRSEHPVRKKGGRGAREKRREDPARAPAAPAPVVDPMPEVSSPRQESGFLAYVRSEFDTFERRPLCAVDSLVLSWIAYTRLPDALFAACTPAGIGLRELLRAEDMPWMVRRTWDPESSRDLLFAVCANPRFRDIRLADFCFRTDPGREEQFAAMTFLLPGGGVYVAFRGTDSTLVGWKEDFNMAAFCPVPSQTEAARYLAEAIGRFEGPVYVGGHSKGGNLAVYAAAACGEALQPRIARIFSHDGPGFNDEFLATEGFARIRGRVEKTVPKSTVIGVVMHDGDIRRTVVESEGVSAAQHNPFLWAVDGCAFREADGLSVSSRGFDSLLDAWMEKYSYDERGAFIDTLFGVVGATGAERFSDVRADWRESLPVLREAVDALEPEQRAFVVDALKALARTATVEKAAGAASGVLDRLLPSG